MKKLENAVLLILVTPAVLLPCLIAAEKLPPPITAEDVAKEWKACRANQDRVPFGGKAVRVRGEVLTVAPGRGDCCVYLHGNVMAYFKAAVDVKPRAKITVEGVVQPDLWRGKAYWLDECKVVD